MNAAGHGLRRSFGNQTAGWVATCPRHDSGSHARVLSHDDERARSEEPGPRSKRLVRSSAGGSTCRAPESTGSFVRGRKRGAGAAEGDFDDENGWDSFMRDAIRLKLETTGKSKPIVEQFVGNNRSADGSYKYVERLFDKPNDLYRERVVDPDTGEVLHYCEEALTLHRGHGSAKAELGAERAAKKRAAKKSTKSKKDLSK